MGRGRVCMEGLYHCIAAGAHLWNGTGHRTVTFVAPVQLTSCPVRGEAVIHNCGTSPVGGKGLVVPTSDEMLPHWNIRPLAP